jgi:hypothetical protein
VGWETRERGGRYYTRSRRVGGRVVREYVGCGRLAELAAALEAAGRRERAAARERARAAEAHEAPARDALAELGGVLDGLAAAHLIEAGYRRHHRGAWRRRRDVATKGVGKAERALPALPAAAAGGEPGAEVVGWLAAMATLAGEGDERAVAALLQACREVPRLWDCLALLPSHAERAWADLFAGTGADAAFARRVVEQDIARKRREVAGEHPTPLEALLAERVALCWAAAQQADGQYAHKLAGGMSFREVEHYARRSEQANRQLLKAVQTLATVRRLLTPTVQLNIARQQVNLAGSG